MATKLLPQISTTASAAARARLASGADVTSSIACLRFVFYASHYRGAGGGRRAVFRHCYIPKVDIKAQFDYSRAIANPAMTSGHLRAWIMKGQIMIKPL